MGSKISLSASATPSTAVNSASYASWYHRWYGVHQPGSSFRPSRSSTARPSSPSDAPQEPLDDLLLRKGAAEVRQHPGVHPDGDPLAVHQHAVAVEDDEVKGLLCHARKPTGGAVRTLRAQATAARPDLTLPYRYPDRG
ncbi:hypothetical protein GCM10020221_16220 [Streptomyces thioluteus]|uniref:Uncharacterized protein n=1 Tax=Streptomyces thioluteus TaxID=66431 RepID=A0ABN3WNK4_STRTU